VAIPTNRLEIIDSVSPAVRAIFAVMDLQRPAAAAAGATATVLLQHDGAVHVVNAVHQGFQGEPLDSPRCFCDHFSAVKCRETDQAAVGRQFPDLVSSEALGSFSRHTGLLRI